MIWTTVLEFFFVYVSWVGPVYLGIFSCWGVPVPYLELFWVLPVKKNHPVLSSWKIVRESLLEKCFSFQRSLSQSLIVCCAVNINLSFFSLGLVLSCVFLGMAARWLRHCWCHPGVKHIMPSFCPFLSSLCPPVAIFACFACHFNALVFPLFCIYKFHAKWEQVEGIWNDVRKMQIL